MKCYELFRYALALLYVCQFIPMSFYWPIFRVGTASWRRPG